ncbi:ERG4/ERG24 ergosterol biosynthesis protein [Gymnopus androsaceus JB14]|uniref:Delta(14)-sterol reductase ERG24 n=1 Tax=Gymnopus androsaceus JB14 TaxID=1447944 RepID=A0A6A4HWW3_9AGAR|nr:ERG4/ERG24 ergosterol biosynthesis protein [Gymnopus androsaceus JB14]
MSLENPRTTKYEFLGPVGAFLISTGVPLTIYGLYYACSEQTGGCPPPGLFMSKLPAFLDTQAALMYLAWYLFCVIAWRVLPGAQVPGTTLRNGTVKTYKINAFSTLVLAIVIVVALIIYSGPDAFTFLYKRYVGFVTASVVMSIIQAVGVYALSHRKDALLALGGNTGNMMYDWFIGRELNPTLSIFGEEFDIKTFNELRPGLILWVLLNISFMCEQATRNGGFIGVTDSMWLVLLFQIGYVVDSLYNEPAILTTMDITTDGFGFMLSVGDLAWVPFTYSLQARYLTFHPITLGPFFTILILFVNAVGYYIFRTANSEKNDFRNGKDTRNLRYFVTKRGSKLITSGWWGRSRHPNYFGDIIMALAWSLPTGFNTPITYFYVVFFGVLLVHRQGRDDEACEKKYGKDWEKYKQIVRWKIIPYIY